MAFGAFLGFLRAFSEATPGSSTRTCTSRSLACQARFQAEHLEMAVSQNLRYLFGDFGCFFFFVLFVFGVGYHPTIVFLKGLSWVFTWVPGI